MENNKEENKIVNNVEEKIEKKDKTLVMWEKIKNKLINGKPIKESESEFVMNKYNECKEIQAGLKELDMYICDGCRSLKKTSELEQIKDVKDVSHFLCKECRKKYGFESEKDVIDELRSLIKTAPEIVKYLDQYIIGQEPVKRAVSVEVRNHFLRAINKDKLLEKDMEINKNNILLTGTSGTGKTLLIKTLAKLLNIPFAIVDATTLTASGYVGADVQSMLSTLLANANYNIHRAEFGIIYIDEVDKIAKKGENMSITRDVSGECVQQALLKMVEGGKVGVPVNGGRINPNQKLIEMDTTNILFICGGAFDGIETIVKDRLKIKDKKKNRIGFGANVEKDQATNEKEIISLVRSKISTADLKSFGLIPEFLGRFSMTCNLLPLDAEQLIRILKSKNGVIAQYKALFELEEKNLKFANNSLESIVKLALEKEVGARGLSSIVSTYMTDVLYNVSLVKKKNYKVTGEDIENYYKQEDKLELLEAI